MSFLKTLETDFEKLFKKTPTEIHLALAVITYAAPIVEGIEDVVDPAALAITQPIIVRIETGLATAYSLANEGTASGATLGTTLSAVASDLGSLESVAGIKDAATQAKINSVVSEAQAVVALLPTSTSAVTAGVAAASAATT
jgi:hypothetical protein